MYTSRAGLEIKAFSTGNPKDVTDPRALSKSLWNGKGVVIVRPLRNTVTASAVVKFTAHGIPDVLVAIAAGTTNSA